MPRAETHSTPHRRTTDIGDRASGTYPLTPFQPLQLGPQSLNLTPLDPNLSLDLRHSLLPTFDLLPQTPDLKLSLGFRFGLHRRGRRHVSGNGRRTWRGLRRFGEALGHRCSRVVLVHRNQHRGIFQVDRLLRQCRPRGSTPHRLRGRRLTGPGRLVLPHFLQGGWLRGVVGYLPVRRRPIRLEWVLQNKRLFTEFTDNLMPIIHWLDPQCGSAMRAWYRGIVSHRSIAEKRESMGFLPILSSIVHNPSREPSRYRSRNGLITPKNTVP